MIVRNDNRYILKLFCFKNSHSRRVTMAKRRTKNQPDSSAYVFCSLRGTSASLPSTSVSFFCGLARETTVSGHPSNPIVFTPPCRGLVPSAQLQPPVVTMGSGPARRAACSFVVPCRRGENFAALARSTAKSCQVLCFVFEFGVCCRIVCVIVQFQTTEEPAVLVA